MEDIERDFLHRETKCLLRYNMNTKEWTNVAEKMAGVLHTIADGLGRQICAYCYGSPEFLTKGYAYEFPLTITVEVVYDGPWFKIEATASAKGAVLNDRDISVPVLKTIKEVMCEESQ